MRRAVTAGMVIVGLVLMAVGFLASAPWGVESVANSNPRLPFAPALFVLGVIAVFSAAVVYERFPDRWD